MYTCTHKPASEEVMKVGAQNSAKYGTVSAELTDKKDFEQEKILSYTI